MLEVLINFEQNAARLSPIVLVGPGLMAVLLGLFIWLGGLGLRKLLVSVTGAVSGGVCGFLLIGHNIVAVIGLAAIAAAIAAIFERLFIAILAAVLAAVLGFVVLATLHNDNANGAIPTNQNNISTQSEILNIEQSVELVKAYIVDISSSIKQAFQELPGHYWAILLILIVFSIVAGFALRRLTLAFCCAALGTTTIFIGMILLLLYKGSAPISKIYHKPSFYGIIIAAMMVFGTIEQSFLCRDEKKQYIRKKQAADQRQSSRRNWRII
jgi:hypothetical protein